MFDLLGNYKALSDLPLLLRGSAWTLGLLLLTAGLLGKEMGLVAVGSDSVTAKRERNEQSVTTTGSTAVSAPIQDAQGSFRQKITVTPRNVRVMSLFNFGEIKLQLNHEETLGSENLGAIQQEYSVSAANDSRAEFTAYIMYDNAAWAMNSAERFVKHDKDEFVDLTDFLDGAKFAADAQTFQVIVCLGVASGHMERDRIKSLSLSDKRAVNLCGQVSARTQYLSKETRVFGVPLGYHTDTSVRPYTNAEKKQRALVIIGVSHLSGALANPEGFREFITGILKQDGLNGFETSNYSQAQSESPLHFLEVGRNVLN